MRAALALIAGGPLRVSTSAAALVAVGAVVGGHGLQLLAALWTLILAGAAFAVAFMALAIGAAMAGVLETPPAAAEPKGGGDA
jgi:hypothetical protein